MSETITWRYPIPRNNQETFPEFMRHESCARRDEKNSRNAIVIEETLELPKISWNKYLEI